MVVNRDGDLTPRLKAFKDVESIFADARKSREQNESIFDRRKRIDSIFSDQSSSLVSNVSLDDIVSRLPSPDPVVYTPPPKPSGGGGFLGPLGGLIKIIDLPRAAIVSAIKEGGDLLQGELPSIVDWWNQTGDNILMGEVLRDWNVDLPGPLDFVVGLGLDIALDPLTYYAGGALAARHLNPAKVVTALDKAADTAQAAKQFDKAKQLRAAAGRVGAKKSILAAGDEALREIGMSAGIRFTVPGTGRLGRRILERPLRALTGRGSSLDLKRVKQLPGAQIPNASKNPWLYKAGSDGLDLTDPVVQQRVVEMMDDIRNGRNLARPVQPGLREAAEQALRMPVELINIPGTAGFVRVTAGAFGAAFGAAAATKAGRYLGTKLSPDYDWHAKFRDLGRRAIKGDQAAAQELRTFAKMRDFRDEWIVRSGQWEQQTLTQLKTLYKEADRLGVDIDVLMMQAAEEPLRLTNMVGATGPAFNPRLMNIDPRFVTDPEFTALHQQAIDFWDGMGVRAKELIGDQFNLIQDELYVARFLADEVATEGLFSVGDDFVEIIRGSPTKGRKYATAQGIAREISFDEAAILARRAGVSIDFTAPEEVWRSQFGEVMADVGMDITTVDGRRMTNKFADGVIQNVDSAGGVRNQMKDLGRAKWGADYKEIFSDDFQKSISRYIGGVADEIRVSGMVNDLSDAGVIADGIPGRAWGKGVSDAMDAMERAARGASVRYPGMTKPSNVKKVADLEDKIARHQQRLVQLEAELFAAEGIRAGTYSADELANLIELLPPASRIRLNEYRKLSEQLMVMEQLAADVRSVIIRLQAGDFEAIGDLSLDAFNLLVPPAARSERLVKGFDKIGQGLRNRDEALNAMDEATGFIEVLAGKVKEIFELRGALERTLAALDNPAFAGNYQGLLDEVDALLARSQEDLLLLNRTYLNNLLQDPTVLTADLLDNLVAEFDTFFKGMTRPQIEDILQRSRDTAKVGDFPAEYTNAERQLLAIAKASGNKQAVEWVERIRQLRSLYADLDPDTFLISVVRQATREGDVVYLNQLLDMDPIRARIAQLEANLAAKGGIGEEISEINELTKYLNQKESVISDVKQAMDEIEDEINRLYLTDPVGGQSATGRRAADQAEVNRIKVEEQTRLQVIDQEKQNLINNLKLDEESGVLGRMLGAVGRGDNPDLVFIKYSEEVLEQQREAAFNLVNDARARAGLSDLYGSALNDWFIAFSSDNLANVSSRTQNALKGKVLISNMATDEYAAMFGEAFQAMARLQDPAALPGFLRGWMKFNNWWKATAISTPGFFMRNALGGVWINNQIANVPMATHARVVAIRNEAIRVAKAAGRTSEDVSFGLQRLIDQGGFTMKTSAMGSSKRVSLEELQSFKSWFDSGIAGSGQVSIEVRSLLDSPFANRRFLAGSMNPFKAEFKLYSLIRRRNQDVEFMLRGALAHHMVTGGQTVGDAFRAVTKYHFDYSNLTQMDTYIKQAISFWTWQKNIIPVLVESIGKQPKAWARLQQVKGELELTSQEEGIVPHWIAENMGIRLPFNVGGSQSYIMPDLPFRDLNRYLKEMENPGDVKGFAKGLARSAGESAMPLFKLPIEVWAGKQVFADLPLTGRYQQMPEIFDVPIVRDVLVSLGFAKQAPNGRYAMRDNHIYTLDGMWPILGRLRRLIPNEESKQEALISTYVNNVLGAGLRINTPRLQASEIARQNAEWDRTWRDAGDLLFRER